MMRITFLAHSGFVAELPSVTLVFDRWTGAMPPLRKDVPLLVLSSHWHEDHFSPAVFSMDAAAFVMGGMSASWLAGKGASPEVLSRCITVEGGSVCTPLPGITVETLPSTDEGVAFLVTADGKTLFHAGDLNWWHWAGEPDPWNPDMARMFLSYTQPLAGRVIDLAMLALDPRMEEDGFRGPKHFLETAQIRRFLPMHQWGNFSFTERFLVCYPQFKERTVPILREGQTFEF